MNNSLREIDAHQISRACFKSRPSPYSFIRIIKVQWDSKAGPGGEHTDFNASLLSRIAESVHVSLLSLNIECLSISTSIGYLTSDTSAFLRMWNYVTSHNAVESLRTCLNDISQSHVRNIVAHVWLVAPKNLVVTEVIRSKNMYPTFPIIALR